MKPSKAVLAANVLPAALLLWLYGGDLYDRGRALRSEVAAMHGLPDQGYAVAILIALLLSSGVFAYGLRTRRASDFRGYRLVPIVAVIALFVDLFVVSAEKLPISPPDHLAVVMNQFARSASALSAGGQVPTDARALRELLPALGPPPYLVRGARPEGYQLEVRSGCTGPVSAAPGVAAVTLIYCAAPDREAAYVTAVALPAGERFGAPAMFARGGVVQWASVQPSASEVPSARGGETPFERGPTPEVAPERQP